MMQPSRYPAAFTLVEMLVSLAIMSVVLTVVGAVFFFTAETTRQAAALSETQAWVRQFTLELEADLQEIDPSKSVLVLVGREIPFSQVGLTSEDVAAQNPYYADQGERVRRGDVDPDQRGLRADLMMFWTQRALTSQAPPTNPQDDFAVALLNGAPQSPAQITYGHASRVALRDLLNLDYSNATHIHVERGGDFCPIPAAEWTLARRAIITQPASRTKLDFDREWDFLISSFSDDERVAGDAAVLSFREYLQVLSDPNEPYLEADPYGRDRNWENEDIINDVLYYDGDPDERFVAALASDAARESVTNLNLQALPGCVSFQVEFLMPEDPRNAIFYDSPDPTDPDISRHYDGEQWVPVEPDATYVFLPDTETNRARIAGAATALNSPLWDRLQEFAMAGLGVSGGSQARNIRLWPYAIRITVKAVDENAELRDSPIERVIVHRFD